MKRFTTLFVLLLTATIQASAAGELLDSYRARLSVQDHFNSKGQRLTSAAAIVRQDRANYHKFGKIDPEDESDSFFANLENRALMEQMLNSGNAPPETIDRIINGEPLIQVDIYDTYIDIRVD